MSNLREKTIRGVGWMAISQMVTQGARLVFMVALARLLSPSEFGLFGMALVFTGFAALLSDIGLSAALIQRSAIEPRHLDTAFWINLILGISLSVLLIITAKPLSSIYGGSLLAPLLMVASLEFVIRAVAVNHRVLLIREMNFRAVAYAEAGSALLAGTLACSMALAGAGAWSLVLQNLAATLFVSVSLVAMRPWRPRWRFDRDCARELLHFGLHLQGFNILNYWLRNLDKLLIGKTMGDVALGHYNRAYSTMLLPQSQVIGILERVMWPALARCAHDHQRLQHAYYRSLGVICLVNFPLMAGLAAVAGDFVVVVFGVNWTPAIPTLQWLCLAGFVQTPVSTLGWLYLATGRTRRLMAWGSLSAAVVFPALWIGSRAGTIEVLAIWYAGASTLLAPIAFAFAAPVASLRLVQAGRAILPPALAAIMMTAIIMLLSPLLSLLNMPIRLTLLVITGAAIYAALSCRTVAWKSLSESVKSLRVSPPSLAVTPSS